MAMEKSSKRRRPAQRSTDSGVESPGSFPPYARLMFGGIQADDEHVTVWEPATGKTVAGNAAPYRRNLSMWLSSHPGWEEKADELKSSKRRSAARRAKAAATSFAALCTHEPIACALLSDAAEFLGRAPSNSHNITASEWTADEYVRLEEALVRLGEELHSAGIDVSKLSEDRWQSIASAVSGGRSEVDVVRRSHYVLDRGITSHQQLALSGDGDTEAQAGYDESDHHGIKSTVSTGSSPNLFSERTQLIKREPRITVWEPSTGRTVSGNAAPCKRNVEAWIAAHPGWEVKKDEFLSASRRAKKLISYETDEDASGCQGVQEQGCESPLSLSASVLSDALEGLLYLSGQRSFCDSAMSNSVASEDSDCRNSSCQSLSMGDGVADSESATGKEHGLKRSAPVDSGYDVTRQSRRLRPRA
mmetsp:Transcript_12570/g.38417  ORF Transcript_12570/g.38417 Transcript_12570/m.38417 type:complete len:418 (+) Transcript_12570:223-1476(+)|eukprot:CAMPEP_0198729938 /NCGR_PEP_ID=MMETSP1475-20131203/21842_1 /TAXON_ID= ORGANISM="Unidentified sp., Strain CCMP1999" /NCGR_SAMPLE_ID=MMETSP1475 /ASSEMBLY_ACC=CAM_ASM_001111 /LENGTH=417 /DNA_ID=CAMNT_0044492665 /DNA_START=278 /DNA_END=1531 /DNA_ORIENTATION=+